MNRCVGVYSNFGTSTASKVLLLFVLAAGSGCKHLEGQSVSANIPPAGGTVSIKDTAAVRFAPQSFSRATQVTLAQGTTAEWKALAKEAITKSNGVSTNGTPFVLTLQGEQPQKNVIVRLENFSSTAGPVALITTSVLGHLEGPYTYIEAVPVRNIGSGVVEFNLSSPAFVQRNGSGSFYAIFQGGSIVE
ncbi:hypothetical protein [Sinorhizobium meliloti]|uniref:hypothetical protein n=1 Tax=Rhizobium meliloti TaxID=382 RepID=UPI00299E46EC|nr:hypothetical protein [Sinorhizobium meliloti]